MTTPAPPNSARPRWPFQHVTILTAHPNGQWSKKWKGRVHYFGPWSDPATALARWQHEWPLIMAGEVRVVAPAYQASMSVVQIATEYAAALDARAARGQLSPRTIRNLHLVLDWFVSLAGKDRPVASLRPSDFAKALTGISKRWGLYRQNQFVIDVRGLFNWALASKLIRELPDYGPDFAPLDRRTLRAHARQALGRALSADDVVLMIGAAPQPLRAMIMLGINAGFGPTDCATLTTDMIDLDKGLLDTQRHKTQELRTAPLWPETLLALQHQWPREPGRVFDWSEERVTKAFTALARQMWVSGTYYDLRRTFATIAHELGDDDAIRRILGQVSNSMLSIYVQQAALARLRRVTDHVRSWLLLPKP